MSSIVFSFDAEAIGVLSALDAIRSGIEGIISVAETLSSSFGQINSSAETLDIGMTSLFANFGAITGAADQASQSMGRSSNSARDLAYQLSQLAQRSSDLAESHKDAVAKIEVQEQRLSDTTTEEIQKRNDAFTASMDKLVESHQNAIDSITRQEENLTQTYLETMNNRLIKLQNPIALQHQQLVNALQQQISGLLTIGDTAGASNLSTRLDAENAKYQTFLTTKIEPYYKELDQKGYDHNANQLTALENRLSKENSNYADQATLLQKNRDQQLVDINKHYNQQEADLQTHLSNENEQYAKQQRDISEQQAHDISNAASSGGRGGKGASADIGKPPPTADGIDLLKRLGIDPQKNPMDATNAIQAWILGEKYKGQSLGNGRGQAFNTQMTIPQTQSVVEQSLALGQDPTLAVRGNENYVDLFANLLAYTGGTAPTRSQTSRFGSLEQIMEKVMAGNTQGLERQFATLGISKTLLENSGVKFGGTTGNTIENSADVFGALETLSHTAAPGLGKKEATESFSGLMNQYKDLWYKTSQQIGDPNNPDGLWKQFDKQIGRLLVFLLAHQEDFVKFGQTIFKGVIDAFTKFNDFILSKKGTDTLHEIGHAFQEIGDALKWIGEHKDIVLLIISLLGMQAGSKLLGAAGSGLMNGVKGFASGGLVGGLGIAGGLASDMSSGIGGLASSGMGAASSGIQGIFNKMFGGFSLGNLTRETFNPLSRDLQNFGGKSGGNPFSPSGLLGDGSEIWGTFSNPISKMGAGSQGLLGSGGLQGLLGSGEKINGKSPNFSSDPKGVKQSLDAISMAIRALGDINITGKNVYVNGPQSRGSRNKSNATEGAVNDAFGAEEQGLTNSGGQSLQKQFTDLVQKFYKKQPSGLIGDEKGMVESTLVNDAQQPIIKDITGLYHKGQGLLGSGAMRMPGSSSAETAIPMGGDIQGGIGGWLTKFFGKGTPKEGDAIRMGGSFFQDHAGGALARNVANDIPIIAGKSAGSEMGPLSNAAMGILPNLIKLGPIIMGIGPVLAGMAVAAGPIILVGAAIAGLIAILVMNREKIMPFINTLINFFQHQLKDAGKELHKFVKEVTDRLDGAFGDGSIVHKLLVWFSLFWAGAWGGIKLAFQGVWNIIVGIIQIVWSIISNLILLGLDLLSGHWGKAWDDIKNLLSGVVGGIGKILVGLGQTVVGIFVGLFAGLWNMVKTPLGDLWTSLMKWFSDLGTGITDFFTKTIPKGISDAFSGMGTLVKSGIDWIVDNVLPGPLKGAVHSALGFADGGQYPGNEVSLVGEKGPELFFNKYQGTVVPNSQIRDALGFGNGNNGNGKGNIIIAGPVHIHTNNAEDLYKQLNQYAGKRAEFGVRGSSL